MISTLWALTDTADNLQEETGDVSRTTETLRQIWKEMTEHKNPKPKMKNVYDGLQGDWRPEVRACELGERSTVTRME